VQQLPQRSQTPLSPLALTDSPGIDQPTSPASDEHGYQQDTSEDEEMHQQQQPPPIPNDGAPPGSNRDDLHTPAHERIPGPAMFGPCKKEPDVDEVERIKIQLPGTEWDGGRLVRIGGKSHFAFTDNADSDVKEHNTKLFLELLYWKQDNNVSHRGFSKLLKIIQKWEEATPVGRENVPSTFDAMLSAIKHSGIAMPYEIVYDTCVVCFFVYRGQFKDNETCGRYGLTPLQTLPAPYNTPLLVVAAALKKTHKECCAEI
jgi:hypothetical protein